MLWLLAGIAIFHVVAAATDHVGRDMQFRARLRDLRAALPRIATEPKPLVLVMGSSLTAEGFIPEVFDATLRAKGKDVVTFNLGVPAVSPTSLLALSRHVTGELLRRRPQPAALSIVEFNPHFATTYWHRSIGDIDEEAGYLLAPPSHYWERLKASPEQGMSFLVRSVFTGRRSAAGVLFRVSRFYDELTLALSPSNASEDDLQARLDAQVQRVHSGDPNGWYYEERGFIRKSYPSTQDQIGSLLALQVDKTKMLRIFEFNKDYFTAAELDEEYLSDFIRMVLEMKRASRRVVVMVAPLNNGLPYQSAYHESVNTALARISRETAVDVLDLSRAPGIEWDDFQDAVHLNERSGAPKFSRALADQVEGYF